MTANMFVILNEVKDLNSGASRKKDSLQMELIMTANERKKPG